MNPRIAALAFLFACTPPGEPSPDVELVESLPVARALAAQSSERWPGEDLPVGWIQTVFAWGLDGLAKVDPDPRWTAVGDDWVAEMVPRFTREDPATFTSSDGLSVAIVASSRGEVGLPVVEAAWDYYDLAPRTDSGALEHWSIAGPGTPTDQVWIDSLFMVGMFLLAEAHRQDDPAHLDLFVAEWHAITDLTQDETGFYLHSWDDELGVTVPEAPVYWLRGNAWPLVSAGAALQQGVDDPDLKARYKLLAQAFIDNQDPETGLWHTVVGDPYDDGSDYVETSGSALVGYGLWLGVDAGILDPDNVLPVVARTAQGLLAEIQGDPLVLPGTSVGTVPGDYDNYVSVPVLDDLPLGYGAVLPLLAVAHGLPLESP